MTNIEKAKEWFLMQNVDAYINDVSLYVIVAEIHIEVSRCEIDYRADLYQSQVDDKSIEIV